MIYVDGELKSLSELTEVIIPQSQIIYARTNSSGQIDLIALSGTDVNSTEPLRSHTMPDMRSMSATL